MITAIAVFMISCGGTSKITEDINTSVNEGSNTKELSIGTQTWMTDNLSVDRFRNGDIIPEVASKEEWKAAAENKQPAWCYFENNPENGERFGKLYNWYAVNDSRGLAPEGWRVSSLEDWNTMLDFLGGESVAGTKIKSSELWSENEGKSGNGTNESGFNAMPGGNRNSAGNFYSLGFISGFWILDDIGEYDASTIIIYRDGSVNKAGRNQGEAYFVRCIKE
jgi:uncharacterized protein (TIGR02145 family)